MGLTNYLILEILLRKEIKNEIDNFYKEMDLPSNDGLNSFLVSKKAKKNNFKVIISGAGGDEFFSGYPSFKRVPIIKNFISKLQDLNLWINYSKIVYINF